MITNLTNMQDLTHEQIAQRLVAAASIFIIEAISEMIPYIIGMFSIILCDLAAGYFRAKKLGEEIRFSRAWRNTLSKMVTYFAIVVTFVIIDLSAKANGWIAYGMILFVYFLEISSIISNLLKTKGLNLDMGKLIELIASKLMNKFIQTDIKDLDGIITKDSDKELKGEDK